MNKKIDLSHTVFLAICLPGAVAMRQTEPLSTTLVSSDSERFLCVFTCVSDVSHGSYVIAALIAIAARQSSVTTLTTVIGGGVKNVTTAMVIIQLSCPQPESYLGVIVVILNSLNVLSVVFVAFLVVVAIGGWKRVDPPAIDYIVDLESSSANTSSSSSLNTADSYILDDRSLSNTTGSTQIDLDPSDGFGMTGGRFHSLPDKY
jgi:hypothetical protein